MRRILLLALALLLLTPHVAADGGTSSDAPDAWADAMPIESQTFGGNLTAGDQDWFLLRVPAGTDALVRVSLTGPQARVEARGDDGTLLGWDEKTSWVDADPVVAVMSHDGWLRIGIVNQWLEHAYSAEWTVTQLPDLVVTDVHVEETPIQPSLGASASGVHRSVVVHAKNVGDLTAYDAVLSAWVEHPDPTFKGRRDLGALAMPIRPGETVTARFTWDALGEWGDVVVVGEARTTLDADVRDNRMRIDASAPLLAGQAGGDLLNHQVSTPPNAVLWMGTVDIAYGPGYKGVRWTTWGAVGLTNGEASTSATRAFAVVCVAVICV